MANDDREAWIQTQADALYADLCAKEAAQEQTTVIEGDQHGMSGGTRHGDQHWKF